MTDTAHQIMEVFRQLDDTEQMILMAGVRALAVGAFNFDAYEAWVDERISRHRAGEKLRLSDLETPPAPLTGLP